MLLNAYESLSILCVCLITRKAKCQSRMFYVLHCQIPSQDLRNTPILLSTFKIFITFICISVYGLKCSVRMEARGGGVCSVLHHVELSDHTQVFSPSSQLLYPLSHLTDPWFWFWLFGVFFNFFRMCVCEVCACV